MRLTVLCLLSLALGTPAVATPIAVDLMDWEPNGGTWVLGPDNQSVSQDTNSPTIAFHSNDNRIGTRISGTVIVETTEDDDFWGFVLGYQDGDLNDGPDNADIDYILIDWKQAEQGGWDPGIAVSRVTGNIWSIGSGSPALDADAWTHTGDVAFVTRSNAPGANFANTGWADQTEYSFVLDYTRARIQLQIDGQVEIDIRPGDVGLARFPEGSFGFYGFSQPNVRYAELVQEQSPFAAVPLPAGLPLILAGMGALALAGRRRG